jgi:hypothetical protein
MEQEDVLNEVFDCLFVPQTNITPTCNVASCDFEPFFRDETVVETQPVIENNSINDSDVPETELSENQVSEVAVPNLQLDDDKVSQSKVVAMTAKERLRARLASRVASITPAII